MADTERKTALVTGGTRGIGRAIALALKADGRNVVATYAANDQAAHQFKHETGIDVAKWDAAHLHSCFEGVKAVEAKHGPIAILVNNAGITRDAPLHKMTEAQWDDVIMADLKSCFTMTRAVIEGMRERGFGRIVNISSINGQRGQFGQANYCAAKAGMIGFTKALALEGASRNITVNAVAPGYVDTDMVAAVPADILEKIVAQIPVKRLGKPEEIGDIVRFLAGDGAGFITGATFSINGGHFMMG